MAYNTGNPPGSTSPKDLIDNAEDFDFLLTGAGVSHPNRLGVPLRSWKGMEGEHDADQIRREAEFDADQTRRESEFDADQTRRESEFDADQDNRETQFNAFMDASGFEPPVPYAPGILLDRTTKTVSYLGNEYRVRVSFMPLTTTNWATDEAKLKLIGDDSLRQWLADYLSASKGVGMLGFDRTLAYAANTAGFALKSVLGAQVPIEMLGGSAVPGHNNGPAFAAYAALLRAGFHPTLLLKGGVYESSDDIVFDRPPKIVGVGGGVFQAGRETDGSYIKDTRPSSANFFFTLTKGAISGDFCAGVLEDLAIQGNHGITANYGVKFYDIGWNFTTRNLSIVNFSKTGLLTYSMNDADHIGLKILACGGLVGGVAYYALDNGPHYTTLPSAGVTTNLQSFFRLHIEHCRFIARINGFAQKFIAPHFEMFADSIISAGHSSLPPIDLGYSGPANAFIGGTFVDVGYKAYASLVPDGVAATPALKLAAIPALIGSTATITGDPVFEGWQFASCAFATADASKYMDLPGHTVYLSNCIAGRAFVYAPGFNLGPGSKVQGNRLHGAVPSVSSDATFGTTVGIKAGPVLNIPATGIPTDVSNNTFWWSTGSSNVANVTDVTPNAVAGGVHPGSCVGNTMAAGYTRILADAVGSFVPDAITVRSGSGGSARKTRLTTGTLTTDTTNFYVVLDAYSSNGTRVGTDGGTIQLTPMVSAASYLGTAAIPWANVVSQTAVVVTSDERSKQQIRAVIDAALRAWAKVDYMQYKFNDAVELKGDGARWHFGVIAQQVQEAFESEGLDAFEYGLLCYDEWEEQPEVLGEDGAVLQEYRAAGNRYGVRYQEAEALQAAYVKDKIQRQDALIEALTSQVQALLPA